MRRARTEGERTRQRILRAALRCFAERGYAATAISDIARAAGVSKPALYYHFRDKADLFRALVTEAYEARQRRLEAALASSSDIGARLRAVMQAWFQSFHENRRLLQLALSTMFAAPGDAPPGFDCRPLCRRNFDRMCEAIREAQARGELTSRLTARELTHAFFGLAHTFLASSLVFEEDQPGPDLADRLVGFFLQGAGPPAMTAACAAD
ncbi:MAG: TetR family transcriptional regulator [Verrucomicrobiota bacterium]|nr:TetR/AcrR family transcriptional regulator [Limisphaera sp.]MDW8381840.1 TetR family transcriptional regulator [Verrucomicrobiota bacterium]